MNAKYPLMFLVSGLVHAGLVNAVDISCTGKVEDWGLTRAGYFYVDGDWNNSDESQRMCHVDGRFDGISSDVCRVWISAIMAATVSKQTVKLKYKNMPSCDAADLGVWVNTIKAPEFIRTYD